jgi:hypothetical protein
MKSSVGMIFDLVLAQVLPRVKHLAALFARILHAPRAGVIRLDRVVAYKPLCYPRQVATVGGGSYIEICVKA